MGTSLNKAGSMAGWKVPFPQGIKQQIQFFTVPREKCCAVDRFQHPSLCLEAPEWWGVRGVLLGGLNTACSWKVPEVIILAIPLNCLSWSNASGLIALTILFWNYFPLCLLHFLILPLSWRLTGDCYVCWKTPPLKFQFVLFLRKLSKLLDSTVEV